MVLLAGSYVQAPTVALGVLVQNLPPAKSTIPLSSVTAAVPLYLGKSGPVEKPSLTGS